jgi:hypothetical protein
VKADTNVKDRRKEHNLIREGFMIVIASEVVTSRKMLQVLDVSNARYCSRTFNIQVRSSYLVSLAGHVEARTSGSFHDQIVS